MFQRGVWRMSAAARRPRNTFPAVLAIMGALFLFVVVRVVLGGRISKVLLSMSMGGSTHTGEGYKEWSETQKYVKMAPGAYDTTLLNAHVNWTKTCPKINRRLRFRLAPHPKAQKENLNLRCNFLLVFTWDHPTRHACQMVRVYCDAHAEVIMGVPSSSTQVEVQPAINTDARYALVCPDECFVTPYLTAEVLTPLITDGGCHTREVNRKLSNWTSLWEGSLAAATGFPRIDSDTSDVFSCRILGTKMSVAVDDREMKHQTARRFAMNVFRDFVFLVILFGGFPHDEFRVLVTPRGPPSGFGGGSFSFWIASDRVRRILDGTELDIWVRELTALWLGGAIRLGGTPLARTHLVAGISVFVFPKAIRSALLRIWCSAEKRQDVSMQCEDGFGFYYAVSALVLQHPTVMCGITRLWYEHRDITYKTTPLSEDNWYPLANHGYVSIDRVDYLPLYEHALNRFVFEDKEIPTLRLRRPFIEDPVDFDCFTLVSL